jgi:hypothetical protein
MQQQLPTLFVLQCLNLSVLHETSTALMQQQLLTLFVLQCLNLSELHASSTFLMQQHQILLSSKAEIFKSFM